MKKILNTPAEEQLAEMLQGCLDPILLEGMEIEQAIEMTAPWQHLIRPQVEAALLLHAMQSAFDPRPGLLPASKKRVLQRIAEQPVAKPAMLPQDWWKNWLPRFVTIFSVLLLLWVGVGSGLQSVRVATPEQTVYAAKLRLEEVQVAFNQGDSDQVVKYRLQYAQTRLDEVDYLITAQLDDYIPATLANYENQIAQAAHEIEALPVEQAELQAQLRRTFAAQLTQNQQRLVTIAESTSPKTRGAAEQSLQSVQAALQTVEVMLNVPLLPTAPASPLPNATNTPLPVSAATQTAVLAAPTSTGTSPVTGTPMVMPTATFTATATLDVTPTPTGISVTAQPTPDTQTKPTKTPKPKPTQKPPPSERPTKEPPPQKPTKEK